MSSFTKRQTPKCALPHTTPPRFPCCSYMYGPGRGMSECRGMLQPLREEAGRAPCCKQAPCPAFDPGPSQVAELPPRPASHWRLNKDQAEVHPDCQSSGREGPPTASRKTFHVTSSGQVSVLPSGSTNHLFSLPQGARKSGTEGKVYRPTEHQLHFQIICSICFPSTFRYLFK